MNMTKKIIMVAISTMWASSAFALLPAGATPTSPIPGGPVTTVVPVTAVSPTTTVAPVVTGLTPASAPVTTEVAPPSEGNSYEKLVTPLLRQISQRKAQLELKKLDREIDKLQDEKTKDDLEIKAAQNKADNPTAGLGNNTNSPFAPVYPPGMSPMSNGTNNANANMLSMANTGPSVRVIMTYGYSNDLYAKIASGDQGGYVVKKGDILPDGREVVDIQPNFISVKKAKTKTKSSTGIEKIFVTGEPTVNTTGGGLPNGLTGVGGNIAPSLAPIQNGGIVSKIQYSGTKK